MVGVGEDGVGVTCGVEALASFTPNAVSAEEPQYDLLPAKVAVIL
jgi:hypothetical protein